MPIRAVNTFKANLKNQLGLYRSHRPKFFQCIALYKIIHLIDLCISKARVSFGKWHQLVPIPYCEGIVSIQISTPSMTLLCIDHHRVDGQWIYLPFPPVTASAAYLVGGVFAL